MSPASSGSLEVEKYIGACLISQTRPKSSVNSRDVFYPRIPEVYSGNYFDSRFRLQRCNSVDRWAGGMPLISFANHQKRNRRVEQQTEIRSSSPKVVEDQQNPLARLAVHTQGAPLILTKSFNGRRNKGYKNPSAKAKSVGKSAEPANSVVDTVSVTSDESSGSGNSDNCLPRIIKPRKRRKKDRKPSILGNPDGFSTDSTSPDIDAVFRPYTPFVFDPHVYGLVPESLPLGNEKSEIFNDVSETPQLHHTFEDVEEVVDVNGNQSTTLCQCRYCDPAGQIWDVDRNCYSPFLTAPKFTNLDGFRPTHSSSVESCLVHGMSSISLEDDKRRKVDPKVVPARDLEVSTEIVTSLNGHRDIEIKFFSSSSSAESVRGLAAKNPDRILTSIHRMESRDDSVDKSVNNECKFALPDE